MSHNILRRCTPLSETVLKLSARTDKPNIPAHLAAILDDADDVTRRDALNVYDLIQSHDREESIRNFYRRDNDQ